MSDTFDLIIRGGQVVRPQGTESFDLGIKAGKFAAFGDLNGAKAKTVFDASGLHILPGVIDSQVHFREPGLEHKEDLETGMRAAVAGGVTAVCEMPNTDPSTTTVAAVKDKITRTKGRVSCDFAFFAGAANENIAKLGKLEKLPGCIGIKIFMGSSTGSLLVADDDVIRQALLATNRRVAVHCEDEQRLIERKTLLEEGCPPSMHPVWRDDETAFRATRRLLALLEETNRRAHVLHVTTGDEINFLGHRKAWASVECTPQHLTLHSPDCYERLGTLAQMNPPIRKEKHRLALWEGVKDGVVDVIGSDHAPHTLEEKAKPYPKSPSGMTGVQTLVPIMLDHVNAGRLSLEKFVAMTSWNPAELYGMKNKGAHRNRLRCRPHLGGYEHRT